MVVFLTVDGGIFLYNKRGEDWKKSVGNYSKNFWCDLVFFRFNIDDEKTIRWKTLENSLCVNVSSRCLCDNVKWLVPVIILFYRKYVNNVQRKSQVCVFVCVFCVGDTRDKKIAPTHNLPQYSTLSTLLCFKCEKALFLPPTTPPIILTTNMTLSKYKFIHGIKHHRLVLFKHVAHKRAKHKYVYKVFHEWKTFSCLCVVYAQRHARMVKNVIMWCLFVIRACTNRWVGDTGGGKYT